MKISWPLKAKVTTLNQKMSRPKLKCAVYYQISKMFIGYIGFKKYLMLKSMLATYIEKHIKMQISMGIQKNHYLDSVHNKYK